MVWRVNKKNGDRSFSCFRIRVSLLYFPHEQYSRRPCDPYFPSRDISIS